MKKFFYFLMAAAAMTLCACNNDDEKSKINTVTINVLIDNEKVPDAVDVTLTSKSSSTSYVATTTGGVATFSVAAGVYEATATLYKESAIYNGANSSVTVTDGGRQCVQSGHGQVHYKPGHNQGAVLRGLHGQRRGKAFLE